MSLQEQFPKGLPVLGSWVPHFFSNCPPFFKNIFMAMAATATATKIMAAINSCNMIKNPPNYIGDVK